MWDRQFSFIPLKKSTRNRTSIETEVVANWHKNGLEEGMQHYFISFAFCCLPECFFLASEERAQWFRSAKNQNVSTGPLACPFARSLAPLTHSLAPPCLLRSRIPLRSFVCSLAHFIHSQARGKVYNLMSQYHLVLTHSEVAPSI